MRILKLLALWVSLTLCFILLNGTFGFYSILIQAINAALFTTGYYLSYYVLIKKLLYKRKVVLFALLYITIIFCLSMVGYLASYEVYVLQGRKFFVANYWKDPVFFTSTFGLVLFVTSSLLSVRFFRDRMQTQIQFENLQKEKISTELDFLKAQINPHFLFNSLNNILFKIDKSNQEARETLLKFSEMLRYQLYDCSQDRIEIEKEVQYIRNYVEIQMLRRTDKYDCHLVVSESVCKFQIAPLLLIPFIENAFKHISNHQAAKNSIFISVDYVNGELIFNIFNDKDHLAPVAWDENKGIGLSNVKRRLDLLYPNNHCLKITESENQFKVDLTIKPA